MSPIRPITKNGKFETTFSALGIPEKNKRNKHAGQPPQSTKEKRLWTIQLEKSLESCT